MSVVDDAMVRCCAWCDVNHFEEDMNCCNTCGSWTCMPFTRDKDEEVCDDCYGAENGPRDRE